MTDPFTSLRRPDERAELDADFRGALLTQVRQRFGNPSSIGPEGLEPAPITIPITLEERHMESNGRSRARWFLAAAAAVVVIGGVTAIVITRSDAEDDVASSQPVDTTVSSTTLPPATTTTLPSLTDAEVAAAVVLPASEYASGWNVQPPTRSEYTDFLATDVASSVPACEPFLDNVFRADDDAAIASRTFYHGLPTEALLDETVLVFDSEETAKALFDAMSEPGFAACAQGYGDIAVIGAPAVDPPFGTVGDQLRYNRTEGSWVHPVTGETHGPEEYLNAMLRVGQVLVFTQTLHMGDADEATNVLVVSEDEFGQTLVNIVDRAESALAGTPKP